MLSKPLHCQNSVWGHIFSNRLIFSDNHQESWFKTMQMRDYLLRTTCPSDHMIIWSDHLTVQDNPDLFFKFAEKTGVRQKQMYIYTITMSHCLSTIYSESCKHTKVCSSPVSVFWGHGTLWKATFCLQRKLCHLTLCSCLGHLHAREKSVHF